MAARKKGLVVSSRLILVVLLAALGVLLAPAASAQTGTVRAIVLDNNRQPIQGAEVHLYSLCTQQFIPQSQSSGVDGTVSITSVPVGAYHIGAYAGTGFNQWIFSPNFQGWQVTDGGTTDQIEIVMEQASPLNSGVQGFARYDDATGAHPIGPGVHIDVYSGGKQVAFGDTNANGQYTISGLFGKLNNWGFYTYIARWTDANQVTHYAHGVNFGVYRGLIIRMDIAFNLRPVPANVQAVSTGSGKITVYWDGTPGASGYNVYRGSSACSEDYSHPANGGTLVTTLSYPGGSVYMFTDTGLTNGNQYFYTVKAAFAGESEPSTEDSDFVDPQAVPWDSRDPAQILPALTALSPQAIPGNFRAMGPDGAIYESGSAQQSPPDGFRSQDGNVWALRDGTLISTMDEEKGDPTQKKDVPSHTGPIHRILSASGFRKAYAHLTLPSDIQMTPHIYPGRTRRVPDYDAQGKLKHDANGNKVYKTIAWSTDDNPWIYLGSTVGNDGRIQVDAGLVYQQLRDTGVFYWRPAIRYSGQRDPICLSTAFAASGEDLFDPGDEVEITYYFQSATNVQNGQPTASSKNVYLQVNSLTSGFPPVTHSVFVKGHPANGNGVYLKRCHSIAQTLPPGTGDYNTGYLTTGSHVQYADLWDARLYSDPAAQSGLEWSFVLTLPQNDPVLPKGLTDYPATAISYADLLQWYFELNISVHL